MKLYKSDLKITDELERRVAQLRTRLKSMSMAIVVAVVVAPTLLPAHDEPASEHPLGDHPAVIISKRWTQSDYMSGTAVYLHPATLWWYMQDPNAPDHPVPGAHPKKR